MTRSPESLLAAFARNRSERDFRALYDAVTPGMLGLATRLSGGDRAAAEDVVQESWFRAVDRIDRFVPGSVARWLNGFVVRCWSEHRRATMRELTVDDSAMEAITVPHELMAWSEAPVLGAAVSALPAGYRAVLVLHDIEGYTHAEIAVHLGIDEGTSKSQLSRARRRLRQALAGGSRSAADAEVERLNPER